MIRYKNQLTSVALWALGLFAAGAVRAQTADGGAQDAGVFVDGSTTPWAGAQAATPTQTATPTQAATSGGPGLPSFLETTDRRIRDDRPPPAPEQLAALREMEAEVDRFARGAASYRDAIVAMVRREYLRTRRAKDEGFGRQIREEERLQDVARDRAIRLFERFVDRYPDDPNYTPDAMFRLGELYYERSALRFQQDVERILSERDRRTAAGLNSDDLVEPNKDFLPTIDLYRRLVMKFPSYRRIDGVYYLIGYCLNEMGKVDESRLAWLNLVCANKFHYDPTAANAPPDPSLADATEPDAGTPHPALALDGVQAQLDAVPGIFTDPFADCRPISAETEFIGEIWLRIGEYHFDYDPDTVHGLDRAIAAYSKVLAMPQDRNFNLALYKLAWSYYRASRYPEAIRKFSELVQWSDDEQLRTGRAGTELRAEAIQYLAISFAYDDWNENSILDPQEGMPSGFQRVQDVALLPQDRKWTPEVYFQLGQVFFDEAKYDRAIEIWQFAVNKFRMHHRVPEIMSLIARSHRRRGEFDAERGIQAAIAGYGPGSDWYNSNREHPEEQTVAERLAETALINAAVNHHRDAQALRRRGVAERNTDLIAQAREKYRLAAEAYRAYIARYPNNPQAYELGYNLAETLFWSENYEAAATEYSAVRDSNLDDSHLSDSARRVVESIKRLTEIATASGSLTERTSPPSAAGTPPRVTPLEMPQLLQRIAQAREIYLARVSDRQDTEGVRAAYDYNNAITLYNYGYWDQAKERFVRIFEERCSGPYADQTGYKAIEALRNIAVQLDQIDEVERLATQLQRRNCTFSRDARGAAPGGDCNSTEVRTFCAVEANKESVRCQFCTDMGNIRFRRGLETFTRAESMSPGDDQRRTYEDSARRLLQAVNEDPGHRNAPVALEQAAVALERTSRFQSALNLYARIIDEVGPRRTTDADEQKRLDSILSNAYFQLAFNANRNFDYDRAIENYRILADRFSSASDARIQERRVDALMNTAFIYEFQQQYARAAEYYRRAADAVPDPAEKRQAYFKIAEMAFKQRDWAGTVREMNAFISRYRSDSAAGEQLVTAYWRIAQARKNANQTRDYRAALQEVVGAFSRSGQAPGSLAAEYAAQAQFELVDTGITQFETLAIRPGNPATLPDYISEVTRQIQAASAQADPLSKAYTPVVAYRRPTWSIAAFVRQGRIYEVLARAVLNTPFAMPRDMAAQLRAAPQEARDEVRVQVEDRIRQFLDQQVRPVECLAVQRYVLAARAARVGNMNTEFTQTAIDRLQAYGDERIQECVTEAQRSDASFGAYAPGEFTRATRGRTLDIPRDVSPPSLQGED